jgi:predicted unusual protein kinase regulating ubiquinone biosynthesis (AarF/ABC1/UbiB family)
MDPRALFAELRTRVMAEVDYRQEADAQDAFAEALRDDPDFLVPAVVHRSDKVLVSEWVDGTPLAQITRTGDAATRDRAGVLLTRFLLSSPARVGHLHGDPHPGNFRLGEDGRLVVVDFGSTLPMRSGWPARLGGLLVAGRDRDVRALRDVATATGLVTADEVSAPALLELLDPFLEPLRTDSFTFDRAWLRSTTTRVSDPRSSAARVQRRLHMPARHLLVQRVAVGTAGVLCLLGATVPVRSEVATWVPGFAG